MPESPAHMLNLLLKKKIRNFRPAPLEWVQNRTAVEILFKLETGATLEKPQSLLLASGRDTEDYHGDRNEPRRQKECHVAPAFPDCIVATPFVLSPHGLQLTTEFLTLLVLALMWNLLAGYADIVTVGQQAFVGIGAYAFFGFLVLAGFNPWISLLFAGLVALPSRFRSWPSSLACTPAIWRLDAGW